MFSLHAQQDEGSIVGQLNDSKGNPLGYLYVDLPELKIHVLSEADGHFEVSNLPAGNWKLTIHAVGLMDHEEVINVRPGVTSTINIQLKEDIKSLNEVTVAAVKKTASQDLKESGFNVNAIETESYQNRTADLNQVLNKTTGIKVRTSGGVGADYNFSINGLSGSAVKFFVDGIPLDVYGSAMTLNNIPVNLAERVEVYKGVVPVELGADAMGGAVNIITNTNIKNYLDASYSFGSFNTHIASLTGQYVHRPSGLTFKVSAFGNYADNNYIMRDVAIWNPARYEYVDKDLPRFHDRYRSAMVQAELGFTQKKWADVFFIGGGYTAFDKQIQTGNNQMSVYGAALQNGYSYVTTLRYRKNDLFLKGLNLSVFAAHTYDWYLVTDTTEYRYFWDQSRVKVNKAEMGPTNMLTHVIRPHNFVRSNLSYRINSHHSLGLNYTLDNVQNNNYNELIEAEDYNPGKIAKQIIGLSYQQEFLKKRLTNTFFLKYYGLELHQPEVLNQTGAKQTVRKHFDNLGYGLASRFRFSEFTGVKVSFERAYRLQEVGEMFGNGFNQIANLELRPEQSYNYNAGIYTGFLRSGHHLFIEGSVYYRDAKDFIHSVLYLSNAQVSQYQNTSKVKINGVEGELRYNYRQEIGAFLNASYQRALNNTKYPLGATGGTPEATYLNKIPNQPWFFANAGVQYTLPDFLGAHNDLQLSWDMQYVHWFYLTWEAYGALDSKSKIPSQYIQNIAIAYALKNGRYNIGAECRNFTNALAYDNFRLQKPGRSFSIKLRYFFSK